MSKYIYSFQNSARDTASTIYVSVAIIPIIIIAVIIPRLDQSPPGTFIYLLTHIHASFVPVSSVPPPTRKDLKKNVITSTL